MNVYANVGVSLGIPIGWNGVGVGDALGLAVTSTSGGAVCVYWGREQARKIQRMKMDASRRGFFMYVITTYGKQSRGSNVISTNPRFVFAPEGRSAQRDLSNMYS